MIDRLRQMLADTLEMRPQDVTGDYGRESSDRWDSLAHLRLITAIEEEFNVVFTMDEIEQISSVATLTHVLERKLS